MNRMYNQFALALEKRVVTLYAKFDVGASGAPTINVAGSKGIASVARSSAGKYLVTLQDYYVGLLGVQPMITLASGSPAVGSMVVRDSSVSTAKTFSVEFLNASFTATDITNGATVILKMELKATSV